MLNNSQTLGKNPYIKFQRSDVREAKKWQSVADK